MSSRLLPLALLLVLVGASGCAAVGIIVAAAGPLFTALQVFGDRRAERTLPADLSATWTATIDALTSLDVHVRETDRSGESWALNGVGERVTVRAELVRVTSKMTRLSLQVEAGRALADKQTAAEILNQVALSLSQTLGEKRRPAADRGDQTDALTALRTEIQQLRAQVEAKQMARRSPLTLPVESESVGSRDHGIVVIPASYGVPTIAVPANGTPTPAIPARSAERGRPFLVEALAHDQAGHDDVWAAPLRPVAPLTPVQALRGTQFRQ